MARSSKPVVSGGRHVEERKTRISWARRQVLAAKRAEKLETEAQVTRLVAMAEDPIDGLAVVFDLAAFSLHKGLQNHARRRGDTPPHLPAPVSRLLTGFAATLREKTVAISELLDAEEHVRLRKLFRGLTNALEAGDPDVVQVLGQMLPADPDVIAGWIRCNLTALEIRFSS